MSILRELFVKLGLTVEGEQFLKAGSLVEGLTIGLTKVVTVSQDLARSFLENTQQVAEYGTTIKRLSAQTGVSADTIQHLGNMAATEGIGIDQLGHSIVLLTRTMAEAARGGETQAAAYAKLGVHVIGANGKLRDSSEVLLDIADKFHLMKDGAEKSALAMQLFGRGGFAMIEVLNRGRAGLLEFMDSTILSEDQIKASKEVVQTQIALAAQTTYLWRSAVGPLLPAIRDLLKQYLEWKKANAELMKQRIQEFLSTGIKLIQALGKAFKETIVFIKSFTEVWKELLVTVTVVMLSMVAANTLVGGSFLLLQAQAVASAIATGAAWVIAALPFVAIAAAVTELVLIFQDLKQYNDAGGDAAKQHMTAFGRMNEEIEKWSKVGSGERPAWVSNLILARDVLKELLELSVIARESPTLGEFLFGQKVSGRGLSSSALTPEARARVLRTGGNFEADLNNDWSSSLSNNTTWSPLPYRFNKMLDPSRDWLNKNLNADIPLADQAGIRSGDIYHNVININGGNLSEVREVVEDVLQSKNEEAAASANYSE